ncbi:MAG: SRPBCC domain-containing protein [bacterium]
MTLMLNTGTSTVDAHRELVITRLMDVPPEQAFAFWTEPALVARWWGPRSYTTPVIEWDARHGGNIHLEMQGPDGTLYPLSGTFHEIAAPTRLVFDTTSVDGPDGSPQLAVRNTVTFMEEGGGTRLTLRAVAVKTVPEIEFALEGFELGWNQSLDRLCELVAAQGEVLSVAMPSDREIVMTRVFDAPLHRVFEAWTQPEQLVTWYGPAGCTLPSCEIDLRPGGSWRYLLRAPDGTEKWMEGVFHKVEPPTRLIYTELCEVFDGMGGPSMVTMTLDEFHGKTIWASNSLYDTAALRDAVIASGMPQQTAESLDRLNALFAAEVEPTDDPLPVLPV